MRTKDYLPAFLSLVLAASIITAPPSLADPYCFSLGFYANCVEIPSYETPVPQPQKPIPIWICKTVYSAAAVMTLIPGGTTPMWIARVVFIPTLTCLWN
jgi:hypothetical protein